MSQKMTSNLNADLLAPVVRCEALWGDKECPNPLTKVIVNTKEAGFAPVCDPHATMFMAAAADSFVMMTVEDFNQQRQNGLYRDYAVPNIPR